jgi:DNA-binding winged helix-turn-helix (wHTH) protein/TolB-like protein/tetratricopeptide (TPR) repeat protein
MNSSTSGPLRFGVFEVDPSTRQVRKNGLRLKLHDKGVQLLLVLLETPGEVVSRDVLRDRLWPDDVFVEFDNNLNNTVSRLREALGDSADSPRFIATVPRRGYQFVAPLEGSLSRAASLPAVAPAGLGSGPRGRRNVRFAVALATVLGAGAVLALVLHTTSAPGRTGPLESLAVLPFVAGETRDEHLAFGLTEALAAELSRIPALKVTSQTSASQYRGASKPLPEIARELRVAGVVEGSIVREGEQVRVTVQLIDAASDTHLWIGTYTRDGRGLLMQTEIARAAGRQIRAQVTTGDRAALESAQALERHVHDTYLRGRFYLGLGTESGRARALTHYEKALTIYEDHAPFYAGLADYYTGTGSVPPGVAMPKARTYARKALELDETLPDAHASLALIHYYGDWDWEAAESQFRRALELDPGSSRTRRSYALFLSTMGRHAEALDEAQRALDLDPLSVMALDSAASVWINAKDPDRAREAGLRIMEFNPDSPVGLHLLAVACLLKKDHDRAMETIRRGLTVSGRDAAFVTLLAHTQGVLGRTAAMQESLAELTRQAGDGFVSPTLFAIASLGSDDRDGAMKWLEKAFEIRDTRLVLLKVSPWFDELRDLPRFQLLLKSIGFQSGPEGESRHAVS